MREREGEGGKEEEEGEGGGGRGREGGGRRKYMFRREGQHGDYGDHLTHV